MSATTPVFTKGPEGLPIWLTPEVARQLGVSRGAQLTRDQYESDAVREMVAERLKEHAKEDGKEML
jgi:hypothetical protein